MKVARVSLIAAMLFTANAQAANSWTACVTITGITNYIAYDDAVILTVSPTIPGSCVAQGIGNAVQFSAGNNGVTAANITALLASALAAYTSSTQVQLLYDPSTTNCYGTAIATNGYAGSC
jgi:hypothetical protein